MQKPDLPLDEEKRLASLKSLDILDTEAEDRFDVITRMAQRLFNVPIAAVSLIDEDRQWFKSSVGLEVTETPRDISFCGHTILKDEALIVPDALADSRFADNPLVTGEPMIRFYAGYPLNSIHGKKIGSFCIIDKQPRTFDAHQLETLKDLAMMVERELTIIKLATTDELTQISNRRGFMLIAQKCLQFFARQKLHATLVFIDLNKFKHINDSHGHAEGDRALMTFSAFVSKNSRSADIIARVGGDEFVILLPDTNLSGAMEFVKKLDDALQTYNQFRQHDYAISFSHGIVEFDPANPMNIDALMSEGDKLMYELKKSKLAA